jgi:hypothetical protein
MRHNIDCRKGHQYQPETFYVEDDEICYTIKRYVHVFEEGDKHENLNNMTKRFECLSGRYRHGVEHFVTCSEATCVICQYQLEHDMPLFDVFIEDIMEED